MLRFVIAQLGQGLGQLLALIKQDLALRHHLLGGLFRGRLRRAEIDHRRPVVAEGACCLVEVAGVVRRQHFGQGLELRDGLVDGRQGGLLEFGLAAVGVTADLEARLLQQFAGTDDTVEQVYITAAEQLLFDLGGEVCGLVSAAAEYRAAGFALAGGFVGTVQCLAVLACSLFLLLDAAFVFRQDNAQLDLLQLAIKVGQGIVEALRGALITLDLEVLPGDAQLQGGLQHLGDAPQGIATLGDAADALPAGQGNAQGQQQDQAEADTEFTIDANVTQVLG
ncbi:hypothetical protein D3C77_464410 [compost metagenome]